MFIKKTLTPLDKIMEIFLYKVNRSGMVLTGDFFEKNPIPFQRLLTNLIYVHISNLLSYILSWKLRFNWKNELKGQKAKRLKGHLVFKVSNGKRQMSTAIPARPPDIKADCIVGFGIDILVISLKFQKKFTFKKLIHTVKNYLFNFEIYFYSCV